MTQVTHLTTAAQSDHTHSQYLTTAMASNRGTDFVQANAVFAGTNATGTIASNGLSVSVNPQTAFQFSNANGVTFGTNGSTVTASVQTNYQSPGAYLTTAALSDHSHGNPTLALTNINGTTASNSAGLTLSLSAAGGAGDGYNIVGVNGNTVGSANTIQFSNSNNVTFGLNGSTITASASYVNDLTSGRAGVGETVGTIAGTDLAMTVNTDGVSIGYPKWITTYAAQSVQPVAASGSNGSFNFSTLQFVTGNGATFYTDATGIRLSYTAPGATVFSNSNNVSFGLNGSTITATATFPAGGGDAIRGIAVAGATLTTNTVNFSNANGVSFGFGAGGNSTVMTASHNALTTAAQSDHSHGNPTLALTNLTGTTASASNGFTLSLSAANPGGGAAFTYSYHNIVPYPAQTHSTSWAQSTSGVYPFLIPGALSMDRVRMLYSGSVAASSTQATTGNTSLSMSGRTSHNIVFYSRGVGASSLSLQYVTSTQVVDQQLVTVSYAANSTQHSYSNRLTLGTASFTKDYSSSATQQAFHTSNLTDLTGVRYIDLPAGLSLSQGQWWVAYGRSTASATQANSISVATRMLVSHNSQIGVSMNTLPIGMIGGNTNSSVGFFPAHGSFTTGGAAGTTASITMANVSTAASNHMLHMQFMRIT